MHSSFRLARQQTHGSVCFRKESQRTTVGVATVARWRISWIACYPTFAQATAPQMPDCCVAGAARCLHSMAEEGSHSLMQVEGNRF